MTDRFIAAIALIVISVMLSGCATAVHGSNEKV